MNILVVGDKTHERKPVADLVAKLGHQVVEATDGTFAWDSYTRTHYDVIISDYLMPEMDGLELCRKVRLGPHSEYTYFIIVSSRTEESNILAGFKSGVDDYIAKPVTELELECRLLSAERVTKVHRDLAHSNHQLMLLSNELRAESRRDPLTGVGNRLRFQDDQKRFLDEHKRYGHRFILGLCDIDNFKLYNDTYGHLEGDRVLKEVAMTLKNCSRASDCVYRYGGEEFLLVLTDQTETGAIEAADRLRGAVEALDIVHEKNPPHGVVTLSIGLARFEAACPEDVEVCLKRADDALYQSKDGGKNCVTTAYVEVSSASSSAS